MTRTTTDKQDGLVWVVRTRDLQARAHVPSCQAIKDGRGFVALRTAEDKDDVDSNNPSDPSPRYTVVVCRCVPAGR